MDALVPLDGGGGIQIGNTPRESLMLPWRVPNGVVSVPSIDTLERPNAPAMPPSYTQLTDYASG
jgi:hypothetical protein